MTPRGMITVATILLFIILGILCQVPAALSSHVSRSCCTMYYRKPLPFHRIKGYREQTMEGHCNIEAIIFYTIKNKEVCVTRNDKWVRKALELLSSKLKKMSKARSTTVKIPLRKTEKPSLQDGSRSFFGTTEAFLNSTESYY
ncbi:C-C motif chemokine 20-like [Parambassis ranga]|uniref:C-C motif chemokine n=1 Tax=Parambassis ranga TaxID=210632 RepID=A0A6P7K3Q7_9TELE|nr:C-C motif chemokine 20-like [Parambassis ranga]XP_028283989.1 C-C motif chemokine 20-like [Parambassis ranga]